MILTPILSLLSLCAWIAILALEDHGLAEPAYAQDAAVANTKSAQKSQFVAAPSLATSKAGAVPLPTVSAPLHCVV